MSDQKSGSTILRAQDSTTIGLPSGAKARELALMAKVKTFQLRCEKIEEVAKYLAGKLDRIHTARLAFSRQGETTEALTTLLEKLDGALEKTLASEPARAEKGKTITDSPET